MGFSFRPAVRENVPLLIGLAGGTGSGKTYTGMRLAKGIAGDKPFAVIDTEAGRAKAYADQFRFDHGDLAAPFTPARYLEAIVAADQAGYSAIVVDSTSHEWAGDGGLLDMQEDELERLSKGNDDRREALTFKAWIGPKREHKRLLARLLQLRAHLILCFRAEAKIEIAKEHGKTVVREKRSLVGYEGWIPITEKNVPYELTVFHMLLADQPGIPHPIKLPQQHKALFPLDQPITEASGAELAAWAKGAPIDWPGRIRGAKTKADLLAIGREFGLARATLQESAVAIIRGEYEARLEELKTGGDKPQQLSA